MEGISEMVEMAAALRGLDRRMTAALDGAVEELGLTSAQYFFLEAVRAKPREHIAAHARDLKVSRQAADKLARQLIRADLVDLLPLDLGVRGLEISPVGVRRLRLARRAVECELRPLAAVLEAEERRALRRSLSRCTDALRPRPTPWWFD